MPVITRFPGGGITKSKQITNLKATASTVASGALTLTWTNPTDIKFKGLEIFYKKGGKPSKYGDGTKCYDSDDRAVSTKLDLTNFDVEVPYYFRAFAYTYKNATRIYTEVEEGAVATITLKFVKGKIAITSSQTWTVPSGVTKIDVFLVGAGGGAYGDNGECGGGGGGYTKTIKNISVTPNSQHSVVIGSGVMGSVGGASKFDNHTANGGGIKPTQFVNRGGDGGSAGGSCNRPRGMDGASDGGNCQTTYGQGSTTKEFGEINATLYAGGGGGAGYRIFESESGTISPGAGGAGGGGRGGTKNDDKTSGLKGLDGSQGTGGGGGGLAIMRNSNYHTKGGSGVCIIRWGY